MLHYHCDGECDTDEDHGLKIINIKLQSEDLWWEGNNVERNNDDQKKDTPRKIGWKKMGRKKEEKCVDDLTRPPQLCWRRHGWEAPAIQHQPFYDSYYYLNIWKDFLL